MFTGLVESTGTVTAYSPTPSGGRSLTVRSKIYLDSKVGDSIAHNGCCLTVATIQGDSATFDLLGETLRATNLGDLKSGDTVNLERSLLPTTRMGGHFVTGHVDTTGTLLKIEPSGADVLLRIEASSEFLRFVIPKGCLTVDGMSLTVAEVGSTYFDIWIIPHTLAVTNLSQRKPGQRVNLESDLLAKYTAKLLGK